MNRAALITAVDDVLLQQERAVDTFMDIMRSQNSALRTVLTALASLEAPAAPAEDEYLNVDQLATKLKRSKGTIYQMTSRHEIPFYKRGRIILFKTTEINAWLAKYRSRTDQELLTGRL